MILIRCTQRLLKNVPLPLPKPPPSPIRPLAEWYANAIPLPFPGRWVVMFTSADSLLTVVAPGRSLGTALPTFRRRLPALLRRIGIPAESITELSNSLTEVAIGRTANRSVLGSMNELAFLIKTIMLDAAGFDDVDLDRLEINLSEVPMGALRYAYPREVAADLLAGSCVAPCR